MAAVDLYGDAVGGDEIVVVGVGSDVVGCLDVFDAVGTLDVEVVEGEHLGGVLAEDGFAEVVVLIGDVDAYLRKWQGIKYSAAVGLARVGIDGGDGVAAGEKQGCH